MQKLLLVKFTTAGRLRASACRKQEIQLQVLGNPISACQNLCTRHNFKGKIHFGTVKKDCADSSYGKAEKFLLAFSNVKIQGIQSPEGSLGDIQERGGAGREKSRRGT